MCMHRHYAGFVPGRQSSGVCVHRRISTYRWNYFHRGSDVRSGQHSGCTRLHVGLDGSTEGRGIHAPERRGRRLRVQVGSSHRILQDVGGSRKKGRWSDDTSLCGLVRKWCSRKPQCASHITLFSKTIPCAKKVLTATICVLRAHIDFTCLKSVPVAIILTLFIIMKTCPIKQFILTPILEL